MPDLSKPAAISDIDVSLVDVAAGRRKLDPNWVETLADLFASQGQMTAIEVIEAEGRFKLVFGRHRLAAAKQLGWGQIAAVVKTAADFAGEADIVQREITENLARRELSALDRAVDISRWREIYEAANGAIKRGRPSKLSQVATINDDAAETFSLTFSEAARKALGINRDMISRSTRIASIAPEVRDRLALHPIADNQSELLSIASEPADRQASIAALLTSEPAQANSVAEAIAVIDRAPKPQIEPRWQKLATSFSGLKPAEQERFFALHEAAIVLWLKGRSS